jgi:hypothetical protein
MPLTFVTALLDLRGPLKREDHKDELFTNFKRIADFGIPFHVFLSKTFEEEFWTRIGPMANIRVTMLEFEDLDIVQQTKDLILDLPRQRCQKKDTREFMLLMNAKAELLHRSIQQNPFQTQHFAWIDFGIGYIFKDWPKIEACLHRLATADYQEMCLVFPGCWQTGRDKENLWFRINWRFCGGFFLGDIKSLEGLYELYVQHFREILEEYKHITWEVNIWHYFELHYGWRPMWYSADHNESILVVNEGCFKN